MRAIIDERVGLARLPAASCLPMSRATPPGRPPQFVDVFELARAGGVVSGELPMAALPRLAAALAEPGGMLRFELAGRIERLPDGARRPAARLRFAAQAPLTCDRCGERIDWPLAGEARYYFVQGEDELARIPVDDSDLEPLLGSARFDLHGLVEDEALLALPMSPRHDDCTAPHGALPAGASEREPAEEGPDRRQPFAALARLKARRS